MMLVVYWYFDWTWIRSLLINVYVEKSLDKLGWSLFFFLSNSLNSNDFYSTALLPLNIEITEPLYANSMLEDNVSNLTVNNNQDSPEGSQNWIEHGNERDHNSKGPIALYDMNNAIKKSGSSLWKQSLLLASFPWFSSVIMMPTKFSEALRAEHYGYVCFFFCFFPCFITNWIILLAICTINGCIWDISTRTESPYIIYKSTYAWSWYRCHGRNDE